MLDSEFASRKCSTITFFLFFGKLFLLPTRSVVLLASLRINHEGTCCYRDFEVFETLKLFKLPISAARCLSVLARLSAASKKSLTPSFRLLPSRNSYQNLSLPHAQVAFVVLLYPTFALFSLSFCEQIKNAAQGFARSQRNSRRSLASEILSAGPATPFAPCLHYPCPWNSRETGVDIIDDHNGSVASSLALLFTESEKANTQKWISETNKFEHSTARPLLAHEFVSIRKNYSLGFTPATLTCVIDRTGPFSDFTRITAASYENILPEKIDIAVFNDTLHWRSGLYLRASLWLNGSMTYSKQAAGEMMNTPISPNAVFLQGTTFALANKDHFDPTVYTRKSGTWLEVPTPPFFRAGGENLGSVFKMGNDTYASIRFNVPYIPSSIGGLGYRSMGVYSIGAQSGSVDAGFDPTPEVKAWISPDECVTHCGLKHQNRLCDGARITLNASTYEECTLLYDKQIIGNLAADLRSAKLKECLSNSTATTADDTCSGGKRGDFIDQALCAHACRFHNQLYQSAISSIDERLYTVVGRGFLGHDVTVPDDRPLDPGNPIHFCAVTNDFTWDSGCFADDSVMYFDSFGTFGHPLVSSMLRYNGVFNLLSVAAPAHKPEAKGTTCAVHLRQWDEFNFSFAQVKPSNTVGQIVLKKFRIPASGSVSVVCQSKDPQKQCAEGLQVSVVPLAPCAQASPCLTSKISAAEFKPAFVKVDFHVPCGCATTVPVELKIDFREWHKIYALL